MKKHTVYFLVSATLIFFALAQTTYAQTNKDEKSQLNALFLASEYQIIAGECVNFFDQSTGFPTYWLWSFPGSETPTSNMQNPTGICYLVPGTYDVVLEIQNNVDVDQEFVQACITVLENTETPIANFTANYVVIPEGEFVTFTDLSQNDPVIWNWIFEGGIPEISNIQSPGPVAYLDAGTYDVQLRIEDELGQESVVLKENFIRVIPESSQKPEAKFLADRTFINPEELVSFTDLTSGRPYKWNWFFEGGQPNTSNVQHPSNIYYENEGVFQVRLVVENSLGTDTIVKDDYIIVSFTDPCTDPPVPEFSASQRLIRHGTRVFFDNQSTNNPTNWNWYFEGGYPTYSPLANPINGVEYNQSGIFKVSLSVNNQCGTNMLVKHDYIFVFSGPVPKYCDTITNILPGEDIISMPLSGGWGQIGGHNAQRIRMYADKFEQHSFTILEGFIVPVIRADYGTYNSRVTFYVWDGNTTYPESDNILFQREMFIRDLNPNFYNLIEFDNPIEIDGPFFIGYRINYVDATGNGVSDDDRFVVSVAKNRNYWGAVNTLYVEHAGTWYSAPEKFNVHTSTAIQPITCIVDISEFKVEHDISIYPNPATSHINISTGSIDPNTSLNIQMIDITGRIVYQKNRTVSNDDIVINVSDLSEGLYFVNLIFDNQRVTERVMIIK